MSTSAAEPGGGGGRAGPLSAFFLSQCPPHCEPCSPKQGPRWSEPTRPPSSGARFCAEFLEPERDVSEVLALPRCCTKEIRYRSVGVGKPGARPAGTVLGALLDGRGGEASQFLVLSSCRLSGFGKPWELKARMGAVSSTPGVRPGGDLRSVGASISCFNFGVSSLSKDDSEFSVPLKSFRFLKGRNPRAAHCQVAALAQRRAKSAELMPDKPTGAVCPGPGARPPRSR